MKCRIRAPRFLSDVPPLESAPMEVTEALARALEAKGYEILPPEVQAPAPLATSDDEDDEDT
jgi:hypothetical protein